MQNRPLPHPVVPRPRLRTTRPLAAAAGLALLALGAGTASAAPLADGGPVQLLDEANLRIDGAAAADSAGAAVAGAGDVNGDGYGDVIVGAYGAISLGRTNAGTATVVYGRPSPTDVDLADLGSAGFVITGAAAFDYSGYAVAGAGDVNGDGYDDVIVGADSSTPLGRSQAGAAYVVFGGPTGADVDLASLGAGGFPISGAAAADRMAFSVGGAGDVNGDGYDDVIVGGWGPTATPGPSRARPTSSSAGRLPRRSTSRASDRPGSASTAPPRATTSAGRSTARETSTPTGTRT